MESAGYLLAGDSSDVYEPSLANDQRCGYTGAGLRATRFGRRVGRGARWVLVENEQLWDDAAATFDQEPDHGLLDPAVRAAWSQLLLSLLPEGPADVVDLGCGTGTLSELIAQAGYAVQGLDMSPAMLDLARAKVARAGLPVIFTQGDASRPPYRPGSFDVVLVRHVVWALPDPDAALANWIELLRPAGRLVLIEGRWSTGAGLTAAQCRALVLRHRAQADVTELIDPGLWGRALTDERYAVLSTR